MTSPPAPRPSRRTTRRRRRPSLMLFSVAIGAFAFAGWLTFDAAARATEVRGDIADATRHLGCAEATLGSAARLEAQQWPSPEEFERSVACMDAAHASLVEARANAGYLLPASSRLGWAPGWGEQLEHLEPVLAVAEEATAQAAALLRAVAPLSGATDGELREVARAVLRDERPDLAAALESSEALRADVATLAAVDWDGPFSDVGEALRILDRELARLEQARSLLWVQLLGERASAVS